MGGVGAIAEPLVVIVLLFGGAWLNRRLNVGQRSSSGLRRVSAESSRALMQDFEASPLSPWHSTNHEPRWRERIIGCGPWRKKVTTPNTLQYKDYFLSRVLEKFPFLVECLYWALIYWIYQLGRATTAVWILDGTIHIARRHALQLIAIEQRFQFFYELHVQHFFLQHTLLMTWINRIYSFIHIPGSIAFLVWLFYYTQTINRPEVRGAMPVGPRLFQARRRTMALCNLLAFIIFTVWPCMPPRLLSSPNGSGEDSQLGRTYGFVDTVHGPAGEGSIWTDNKYTNKYAAMPSLHFGYSLLIGLTIATLPLPTSTSSPSSPCSPGAPLLLLHQSRPHSSKHGQSFSSKRLLCVAIGVFYPSLILVAIIATANHFLIDAIAGAVVCGVAWWGNEVLVNLCVVEDWFLFFVCIHKPGSEDSIEGAYREWEERKGSWKH